MPARHSSGQLQVVLRMTLHSCIWQCESSCTSQFQQVQSIACNPPGKVQPCKRTMLCGFRGCRAVGVICSWQAWSFVIKYACRVGFVAVRLSGCTFAGRRGCLCFKTELSISCRSRARFCSFAGQLGGGVTGVREPPSKQHNVALGHGRGVPSRAPNTTHTLTKRRANK